MQIEFFTVKGVRTLNEDSLILNDNLLVYGVADGVSSLNPFVNNEGLTGGYIASKEVKNYFESLPSKKSLYDGLLSVNQRLRNCMRNYEIDIEKKEQLWGTALSIVKITDTGIEFIQTGDCMIIVVYNNDEIRLLTRLQVEHLESVALKKWKEHIDLGIKTQKELSEKIKQTLVSNRKKSNMKNGYGVLNGEHNALDFVESGKINKIGLKHLILLTDGMLLPKEVIPEGESYWEYLTSDILAKGIKNYTKDLIELEENDPECLMYHRLKKSDDKGGIVINF